MMTVFILTNSKLYFKMRGSVEVIIKFLKEIQDILQRNNDQERQAKIEMQVNMKTEKARNIRTYDLTVIRQ